MDVPRGTVFVDTSFLFALTVSRDQSNPAARSVYDAISRARRPILTTNFVLVELHSLITNRVTAAVATRVLFQLEASDAIIVRVSEEDEAHAGAILRQYTDKGFSLQDATSFAVMERMGIDTALSFDKHFAQYRWTVLD